MLRTIHTAFLGLLVGTCAGCAGGSGFDASLPAGVAAPTAPQYPDPIVLQEPQMPAVDGEVIGYPGSRVGTFAARYSWTGLGWLGNDDDVIFEAVIIWDTTFDLGCGILRRDAAGKINFVLMQGQPLPGTGGGTVMHPRLPLQASSDALVIPARVQDGAITEGLFLVPKGGGAPVLLAGEVDGEFVRAEITADGTVLASVVRADETVVLVIPPGEAPAEICRGCAPGFSTDGKSVVVRKDGGAVRVDFDGIETPIIALGDPAAGSAGSVIGVRSAWITAAGRVVLHVQTDDADRPDVLLRIEAEPNGHEVVAACGAPAPGGGRILTLEPAIGPGEDLVFAATVTGAGASVFRAAPDQHPELIARTGDDAGDLAIPLVVLPKTVVAGERIAFGAKVGVETGVFLADATTRVLTTDARVPAIPNGTIVRFLYPIEEAVHARSDGRTLVHVGIREDRAPDSTFGALLLIR